MKHSLILISFCLFLFACSKNEEQVALRYQSLASGPVPTHLPKVFNKDLNPGDQLLHRGMFSPDYEHFYFTTSNQDFTNFTIKAMHKTENTWSDPKDAFFNSMYDDHGMSYSPDGDTIYFSSTRPVNQEDVENTWHLWRTSRGNDKWSAPEFVDIPNLRDKLVSHPTVTESGRLYFDASNLDYSNMNVYYADQVEGEFQNAKLVFTEQISTTNKCTPFIDPAERYLIYARVEQQLILMISHKDHDGKWGVPLELNKSVNTDGQGNPFVTFDEKFLFFASGKHDSPQWQLKWVSTNNLIKAQNF
ncbi:MAG: sialidase family protein [Bacteroidota bacterium]